MNWFKWIWHMLTDRKQCCSPWEIEHGLKVYCYRGQYHPGKHKSFKGNIVKDSKDWSG